MHSVVIERAPSLGREASKPAREFLSVCGRIAGHAAATPGHVALVDGSARLTYAELEDRSDRLAAYLRDAGAGPEQCVGLLLERSADFVVAALAAMKAQAAYLPLDPSTPVERLTFILSDANAPLLVSHRQKTKNLSLAGRRVIDLDGADVAKATSYRGAFADPGADQLAYVIYTSGSTGRPKGVEITHANLTNLIDWHLGAFNVTAADRASQVAGLGFDAAGWEIWPTLAAGATLHIADDLTRRSAPTLREWLIAEKITIAFVPTVLAEQLLQSNWPTDTALRTLLTGADTLHRRPAKNLPFVFVNNYGPTECTVVATSGAVLPHGDEAQPSIGRAISNATVLILDEQLRPVPAGQPGELCLAGALVGRGYRNNPKMTAARFVTYEPADGPAVRIYRTGDRAKLLDSGEIAFLGRLDDQVKVRGYRIELGEIVSNLDRYPGIEASAVIAREAAEGPTLVAYVVAARDAKLLASDVREFLGRSLPDYMLPSQFVKLTALPITANGKLDKANLPAPNADNLLPATTPALGGAGAAPGAGALGLEQRIAGLVASLLGQPSVQREDNFFMLGGHSMLGAQLVARIRETFNVKLTLRQLFGAPTVAALTAEITRLTETASKSPAK